MAVLGTGPLAVHQALMFRQWSDTLTLLMHTAQVPTDEEMDQLSARGINVVHGEVTGLVVTDDRLTGVQMASREVIAAQVLVVGPRSPRATECSTRSMWQPSNTRWAWGPMSRPTRPD